MEKEIKQIDLIIIGAGPAGLTAAIYASRANLETLVLEKDIIGGQVKSSYTIENYPGFKIIKGSELGDRIQEQAEALGAIVDEFDSIEKVVLKDEEKIVETGDYIYKPKAVIIATGATPVKLSIPDEKTYEGKGIHYCALCDGAIYKDEIVAVVGGGNAALEESMFLAKFAKKVIIIRRHDYFKGEDKAIIKNTKTSEEKEIPVKAVFGYIGTEPKTDMFKEHINVDNKGYIPSNEGMETNVKGVYVAGDVRVKEFRQITTAVADGTIAALQAEKYINSKK